MFNKTEFSNTPFTYNTFKKPIFNGRGRGEKTESKPVVSNVGMSGVVQIGSTLTGNYTYSNKDGTPEGASVYKWYRADDRYGTNKHYIIEQLTYNITKYSIGKYLILEITPATSNGVVGDTVSSSYTIKVPASYPIASNVTASGIVLDDEILTGSYTYSNADGTSEGSSQLQWYYADDEYGTNKTYAGAGINLTMMSWYEGKYLTFQVTPKTSAGVIGNAVTSPYISYVFPSSLSLGNSVDCTTDRYATDNSIIKITDTMYVSFYFNGVTSEGHLVSLKMSNGVLTKCYDVKLAVDPRGITLLDPTLIKLNDSHFAIAYTGTDTDGYLVSYYIGTASGTMSAKFTIEFDVSSCYDLDMQLVGSNHIMLVYSADYTTTGKAIIFYFDSSFYKLYKIQTYQFWTGMITSPSLVVVSETSAMIAFQSSNDSLIVKYIKISSTYAMSTAYTNQEYNITKGSNSLVQVDDSHLFLAAIDSSSHGILRTFSFNPYPYSAGSYSLVTSNTMLIEKRACKIDDKHIMICYNNRTTHLTNVQLIILDDSCNITEGSKISFYSSYMGDASMTGIDDRNFLVFSNNIDNTNGYGKATVVTLS